MYKRIAMSNKSFILNTCMLLVIVGIASILLGCGGEDRGVNDLIFGEKTFGGSNDDESCSIQQTSDTGYIIVGYTQDLFEDKDVYIIKIDWY